MPKRLWGQMLSLSTVGTAMYRNPAVRPLRRCSIVGRARRARRAAARTACPYAPQAVELRPALGQAAFARLV
jgi:hypothetical protein